MSEELVETLRFFHPAWGGFGCGPESGAFPTQQGVGFRSRVDKAAQRRIHQRATAMAQQQSGFSLIELAIVLVVTALLLGGLLVPLSMQIEQQKIRETQKAMEEIKEALVGFAIVNSRLPCPDMDLDGYENPPTPTVTNDTPVVGQSTQTYGCPATEGGLPYQTLGVSREDGWSNRFGYRITSAFGQRVVVWDGLNATGNILSSNGFALNTVGDINVQTRGDNPATLPPVVEAKFLLTLASTVPAVVISYGKNGYGATSSAGYPQQAVPADNVDETTNVTLGITKITRTPTSSQPNCSDTAEENSFCEFDDLVAWLSPNILFSRMVAAGRLP